MSVDKDSYYLKLSRSLNPSHTIEHPGFEPDEPKTFWGRISDWIDSHLPLFLPVFAILCFGIIVTSGIFNKSSGDYHGDKLNNLFSSNQEYVFYNMPANSETYTYVFNKAIILSEKYGYQFVGSESFTYDDTEMTMGMTFSGKLAMTNVPVKSSGERIVFKKKR